MQHEVVLSYISTPWAQVKVILSHTPRSHSPCNIRMPFPIISASWVLSLHAKVNLSYSYTLLSPSTSISSYHPFLCNISTESFSVHLRSSFTASNSAEFLLPCRNLRASFPVISLHLLSVSPCNTKATFPLRQLLGSLTANIVNTSFPIFQLSEAFLREIGSPLFQHINSSKSFSVKIKVANS